MEGLVLGVKLWFIGLGEGKEGAAAKTASSTHSTKKLYLSTGSNSAEMPAVLDSMRFFRFEENEAQLIRFKLYLCE